MSYVLSKRYEMGFPASCTFNDAGFILAVAADVASESHMAAGRCQCASRKRENEPGITLRIFHFPQPLTKMLPNVPATVSPAMLRAAFLYPHLRNQG